VKRQAARIPEEIAGRRPGMDAKAAAQTALDYVKELFEYEKLSNLGLEEVQYLPESKEWLITVGFSRPWDYPPEDGWLTPTQPVRDYKVVHIDDGTGQVLAIKNRSVPEPATV
jgi:hypothetical protein